MLSPVLRALAVLGLAAAALAAGAPAASAHAVLKSTEPQQGAVLAQAPAQVVVTFDDTVGAPAYLTVTGPTGRVDAAPARISGVSVSVPVRPGSPPGAYTVAYRVVSDDGHPVEGTFGFRLSAPAATTAASGGSSPPAPAVPSVRADAAAAAPAAAGQDQGHGQHWFAGIAGGAMVLAGAGALVWERRQRGRAGSRS